MRTKIFALTLIVVFIFDFFLYPAPILAASSTNDDIAEAEYETNKVYYFIHPDTENLVYFVGVKGLANGNLNNAQVKNISAETSLKKEKIVKNASSEHLPENQNKKAIKTGQTVISAYNSEESQCDASPCITANGFNVCKHGIEDTIAANHLSFGTKVKIPDLFGDRVFVVRDRMNSRYTDRIDVWMKNKVDAIQFGVRTAKIEIVE